MAGIILDVAEYHARTNRVPPRKGAVEAQFMVGNLLVTESGDSFEDTVNAAKAVARATGATRVVLVEVAKK